MGIAASGPELSLNTPRATRMHLVFCHIAAPVFQVQTVVLNGSTREYGSRTSARRGYWLEAHHSSYRLERVLQTVALTCFEDGMISGGVILWKVA